MKGYWHFPAISALVAVLATYFSTSWFIVGFFLWLFYLYYFNRLGRVPIIVSLTFFLFFTVYIPSPDNQVSHDSETLQQTSPIIGEITQPVSVTDNKIEFLLEEQETKENIPIIFFPDNENPDTNLEKDLKQLKYGAICSVEGTLELPATSSNPGQFDYRNYLSSNGITYQMIIPSFEAVDCTGSSFLHRFYNLRANLISHVKKHLSDETSAWLNALVLGDDSNINEETIELFQRWGLSHILAISGLHVGIVVAFVYFLLIKLNVLTKEKAQIVMICFLPVFAILAGGAPSVLRASMMVLLVIILSKWKVSTSSTDILSIVFLFLILIDKYIVYHVGFQLSFIVTFGLILSKRWIADGESLLQQGLRISFISQMMIIPLQFNYFSTLQPLSIILNMVVVPYFSLFVIPFMFLLFILSFLPSFLITFFDMLFVPVHGIVIRFIEFVDKIAYYPWIIGSFSLIISVIYYLLLFLFMYKLVGKKRLDALKLGVLLTVLIICVAARPYFSPVGTVTMLDIGQGDAFVIELPYRQGVMMIDAGANLSFQDMEASDRVYKQIIKEYLHSKGIREIDTIVLTHDDVDHMGSIPFMIEEMNVQQLVISPYFDMSKDLAVLLETANVDLHVVERGERLQIHDQPFYVLAPSKDYQSANENSIVLYTELGGKYWLFTGDIGKEQEKELLETYPNLIVDVLKVAHHGSNTSTDEAFISHINPEISLISVGENNAYGHPTEEVIHLLMENNSTILRTDQHGAVQFCYKENEGTFYHFLP